jgi:hypothetical protein
MDIYIYPNPAKPVPQGTPLTGTYKRYATTGFGGGGENSASTSAVSLLSFSKDGRFSRSGSISSTIRSDGATTVASGGSNPDEGRYNISGWTLTLQFNSGQKEQMVALFDSDLKVVWLDGKGYVKND